MKKILVVFTGGTIGSTVSEGVINTSNQTAFQLLQLFQIRDNHPDSVHFDTLQPLQILSENLAPPAWQTLIHAIENAQPEQYDGIIITHGTDTLAYTAAALSFYFNGLQKPVLLVSSNYPLTDARANGLENFICAVEFIRQHIGIGVFVPYQNPDQPMHVHSGCRLACSLQLSGDFFSVQHKSAWQFAGNQFIAMNPPPTNSPQPTPIKVEFSSRVVMVKPYPGLNYRHINLENTDAVLHDLYHSGTACVSRQWGNDLSLTAFIEDCRQRGIVVYLAPIIKSDAAYQSTATLIEQGVRVMWDISIEAAYVKLLLAYGNFSDDRNRLDFVNANIAGERIG